MKDATPSYLKTLAEVYRPHSSDIRRRIELLAHIYDLPEIKFHLSTDDSRYFEYVTRISNFVVVVFYTSSKYVFLQTSPSGDGKRVTYSLPARSIRPDFTVQDTINSLAAQTIGQVKLAQVEPVALLKHSFSHSKALPTTHEMQGLAYVARLLDSAPRNLFPIDGYFVPIRDGKQHIENGEVSSFSNSDVLSRSIDRIQGFFGPAC
jgi:hypothetical protein